MSCKYFFVAAHAHEEGDISVTKRSPLQRLPDLADHGLEHLNLRGCHSFRTLPNSLETLSTLQTLDLSQTNIR